MKEQLKQALWQEYKSLGADGLKANHYTLALTTKEHDPEVWKEFLTQPDVNEYIQQETALLQEAEFRSILLNTARDNSAGRAQLINAMLSVSQKQNKKEGPIVIYSYVPLNEEQAKSDNYETNDDDIFKV